MLVERSVMEQRFEAVMAVVRDGQPVTEVAARLGCPARASTAGSAGMSRAG